MVWLDTVPDEGVRRMGLVGTNELPVPVDTSKVEGGATMMFPLRLLPLTV